MNNIFGKNVFIDFFDRHENDVFFSGKWLTFDDAIIFKSHIILFLYISSKTVQTKWATILLVHILKEKKAV